MSVVAAVAISIQLLKRILDEWPGSRADKWSVHRMMHITVSRLFPHTQTHDTHTHMWNQICWNSLIEHAYYTLSNIDGVSNVYMNAMNIHGRIAMGKKKTTSNDR